MKKNFKSLFCLFFIIIFNFAYSEDCESYFEIDHISYENIGEKIRATINLNNGYQFIFSPELEEEYLLAALETDFCPGTKVVIGRSFNCIKPYYVLRILGKKTGFLVSLSFETAKNLPSIKKIEEVKTGWFSSDWHLYLSDGTAWQFSSYYNYFNWEAGQRILFTKNVSHLTSGSEVLIANIEAIFKGVNHKGILTYYDHRWAMVKSIPQ